MKVSPLSPPTAAAEQKDVSRHDNSGTTNNCSGLKRRRLHSQTNIIINDHYRHRKHLYTRHDDKSSPIDCFEDIDNDANIDDANSCNNSTNSGEDASDCDESSMTPGSYPVQRSAEGGTSSPTSHHYHRHDKKVRAVCASYFIRLCVFDINLFLLSIRSVFILK